MITSILVEFARDNASTSAIFVIAMVLAKTFIFMNKGDQRSSKSSNNNNTCATTGRTNIFSKYPPGPWSLPFIGYLPMFWRRDKLNLFRELREKYGDLVYFRVGCRPFLIVGGQEMIHEVLAKRSREFEGRPQMYTTLKPGQGKAVVNASGAPWKEHRSFLVSKMKGLGMGKTSFEENIQQELRHFLEFLESKGGQPFDYRFTFQTAMANIVTFVAFGKGFNYDDEEFISLLKLIESNMKLVGGTVIVNYFPFLQYLPGDLFKCKVTMTTLQKVQNITKSWMEDHKSNFQPTDPRDIIDHYLVEMYRKQESKEHTYMDESQLVKLIGDLLVAGTDTTATTLEWMLLFLIKHPKVQENIYREIDEVVGPNATVSMKCQDKMPYTKATILETQRLADIAPVSLLHSNPETVSDLRGYTIPKGTVVVPFLNSVHHSPDVWDSPMEFRPERFLDSTLEHIVNQNSILPFSTGSRMCPGRTLASMEIFFFLVSIVQKFVVRYENDDEMPSLEGHLGIVYTPDRHKIRFVPRT